MALFAATYIEWGIALLLGIALAEYAKFTKKSEKGFGFLATAGVFFLFAGVFPQVVLNYLTFGAFGLDTIFAAIGWILALIGTLFVAYEVLFEK
ncbi:MAG: hypothetical protein NZ942_02565 [Candidatus Aenigmarchaeota archaeon]|nr:hypothetical protein [Candidatus Aenigmarchaeota archaeon]